MCDLKQCINGPTHNKGHTLDVIITRNSKLDLITNTNIHQYELSHHFLITFTYNLQPSTIKRKMISYRKLKNIDKEQFCNEIKDKLVVVNSNSFAEKVSNYNETLRSALNKIAPIKSKQVKIVPSAPWFDCEYESIRKLRRKAEKKYRKSKLDEDKKNQATIRKNAKALAVEKKKSYVVKRLNENKGNLYQIINQLLDVENDVILPHGQTEEILANDFHKFFTTKVEKIRCSILPKPIVTRTYSSCKVLLTKFQ